MSAGLPYLQKLRKSELSEIAESTNLPSYGALRKAELELTLDEHLRANQTTYSKDKSLVDYYKRLTPRSPVKRESGGAKSDRETTVRKPRRKTITPVEDTEATSDTDGPVTALVKRSVGELVQTPARVSASFASALTLPPSPGDVTDAIDLQTTRIRTSVSEYYTKSGIHEASDLTRDLLSSPIAINVIALAFELYGLSKEILPSKPIGALPAIPYVKDSTTRIFVPDLFLLLSNIFWAPFSLWLLTSLLLPLTCAYFVNIPLKASMGHSYGTRRATAMQNAASNQWDPLVFNVSKALIAYVVYAQHFTLGGLYQNFTITTVDENVIGGYAGTMTTSAIAGLMSVYEAILTNKQ